MENNENTEFLLSCIEQKLRKYTLSSNHTLNEAILHQLDMGGKRIRTKLAVYCGMSLGLSDEVITDISAGCELLHNASLIHDDIQDADDTRRGRPSVWAKFGKNTAICTGDLLMSAGYLAFSKVDSMQHRDILAHVHRRISETIDGQILDLEKNHQTLDFNEYQSIVSNKSGSLLALPLELCFIANGQFSEVTMVSKAAYAFAIAYQILDDIDDWESDLKKSRFNILSCLYQNSEIDSCFAKRLAREKFKLAKVEALNLPKKSGQFLVKISELMDSNIQT